MARTVLLQERPGRFRLSWDEEHRSVVSDVRGFWNPADGRSFASGVIEAAARSRQRNGHALLLFDATEAPVQLGSMMADGVAAGIVRDGDRVAVVVASSLLKMQMKRTAAASKTYGFFLSRSAAETWLYAHLPVPAT